MKKQHNIVLFIYYYKFTMANRANIVAGIYCMIKNDKKDLSDNQKNEIVRFCTPKPIKDMSLVELRDLLYSMVPLTFYHVSGGLHSVSYSYMPQLQAVIDMINLDIKELVGDDTKNGLDLVQRTNDLVLENNKLKQELSSIKEFIKSV